MKNIEFMKNVSKLKLDFNEPINGLQFPPNLTVLIFGNTFNQSIETLQSLNKLKELKFGNSFNQKLGYFNRSEDITDDFFDGDMLDISTDDKKQRFMNLAKKYLPESIESLKFGNSFNKKLGVRLYKPSNSYFYDIQPDELKQTAEKYFLVKSYLPNQLKELIIYNIEYGTFNSSDYNEDPYDSNNFLYDSFDRVPEASIDKSFIPQSIEKITLFSNWVKIKGFYTPFTFPNLKMLKLPPDYPFRDHTLESLKG